MDTDNEDIIQQADETGNATENPQSNPQSVRKERRIYNRWLVKNIPYYFFLAALAIFYIANGHYADKMMRETVRTEKKLKEMNFDYKVVKREVIFRSKQSELVKVVAPLGLEELTTPPVIIKDTIR